MPPRIVYITSLGHSGSTLLDLLISGHSEAVSVGEAKLFRPNTARAPCSCRSKSVWVCPFWNRVDAALQESTGLSLRQIDLCSPDPERFAAHNAGFYNAVAVVSGKQIIVDSSKSNSRLQPLLACDRIDVSPVHLIRRPHGVIYSQIKKERSWLRFCRAYTKRTWRTRWLLRGRDHVLVRYEDLATNPKGVLTTVMGGLGLVFEPQQLDWAGRERHNRGGNRMRRSPSSTIRLDDEWRHGLTRWQKLVIRLLTLPVSSLRDASSR